MKRPSNEIESLGTSAIDLFASGMGAFILIALIFMVMYSATPANQLPTEPVAQVCPEIITCPETPECPTCQECEACEECKSCPPQQTCPELEVPTCPECPDAPICPQPKPCPLCAVCPEIPDLVPDEKPTVEIQCPEPVQDVSLKPLPDLDLIFVLDTTGSMKFQLDALKRELRVVTEVLEQIMPSVAIGFVTVNDRRQRPTNRTHELRRLTGDQRAIDELHRFLRGLEAGKGIGPNPDQPEAFFAGLTLATRMPFRHDVQNRAIVIITDAYAYSNETAASYTLARQFASQAGSRVSTVHIEAGKFAKSEEFLTTLARAGKGEYVIDRGTVLANVMLSVL